MSNTQLMSQLDGLPEPLRLQVSPKLAEFLQDSESVRWLEASNPDLIDSICKVWACSDFVSRYCVKHPHLLEELSQSGDLHRSYDNGDYYKKLTTWLAPARDQQQLSQLIRQFRYREMVRIAWRDIAGWASVDETLQDLTHLADSCIALAENHLQNWLVESFGEPCDDNGVRQNMVIVGMGKLGAHELNFSSDIDLIFAYPQAGTTQNGPKSLSNEEFFTRLGRQLINVLDQLTADGFVFRVDMRLRPFGDSGPLVISFDALESYYQIHGREWERYAMIKARAITGGEDAIQLMNMLRPFVYRRYLDFGAYDSLRDMKRRIETEIKRKGMEDNIKLGPGGIREIEFIGQAFQLIRGGREPQLQQRRILTILQVLAEKNILPEYVVKDLIRAYEFLRVVENRLQQYADQQTHILPKEETARLRLAYALGFDGWEVFKKALDQYRNKVHSHFEQVFSAPQTEHAKTEKHGLSDLWLGGLDENQAESLLREEGFADPEQAYQYLQAVRQSSAYMALSSQGKLRMDRLMPLLLGAVSNCDLPDRVLKRLLDLVQAIARRTSYLALLVENPMALSQLVKLCAASPWIGNHIAKQPILLDELLDPRSLYRPPKREQLEAELQQRTAHIDKDDLELQMDSLRQFKNANVLRVAAADISEAVPLMVVSDHLTYIAETVTCKVLELAWRYMVARHGKPTQVGAEVASSGFAVVAYGKLGGIELGYGSDLDLVFLYDAEQNGFTDGAKPVANSVFYSRLGQRMIHIFTSITPAGTLYEVDMRLRPSGASGLLVTHIGSFEDYQRTKAWTWEHQALVRARPVAGDNSVIAKFLDIRKAILSLGRDRQTVREEVINMRERMRNELLSAGKTEFDLKQGLGGITDIEFMVQYAVLAYASEHAELTTYTDNIRILQVMIAKGLISQEKGELLIECYKVLRTKIHRLILQGEAALTLDAYYKELGDTVHEQWLQFMQIS